ncbi:uncharacterized protein LAESUDRAFT_725310 [Laetiporus sulphureus 93-53]|uniref:DUF6533 domain-containing protein n=1 Tax=Laetiporus sulphureus 93-53 TaxID=1314785 RepID=A0A165EGB2_9APHY|nr:uncharacterized protein LAESUDRAFT_725310 [Laetiporus sulphureus 93-53]KZT06998.1 hypothetical protein LAESUDRAFT_725310 [Laetiporus sulphureus 93-53]
MHALRTDHVSYYNAWRQWITAIEATYCSIPRSSSPRKYPERQSGLDTGAQRSALQCLRVGWGCQNARSAKQVSSPRHVHCKYWHLWQRWHVMTRKAVVHVAVTVTICDHRFEMHRMHKRAAKLRLLPPLLLETFNMPESRDIMAMLIGASFVETCLYLSASGESEATYPLENHVQIHENTKALVLYDYLLTAGDEYCYMWKSELSFASALFFAFRYCAVFDIAVAVLSLLTLSSWPAQLVSDIHPLRILVT